MKVKITMLTLILFLGLKPLLTNVEAVVHEPSDEKNWGYEAINLEKELTGKGVKIAILDVGLQPHEAFTMTGGANCFMYPNSENHENLSYEVCANEYEASAGEYHGNFIAGIISSERNNKKIKGIAPDAELYAIKVFSDEPFTNSNENTWTMQSLIRAVDWAIYQDIDILNISLELPMIGTDELSIAFVNKINEAKQKGIYIVTSAGNYYNEKISSYKDLPAITTVTGAYTYDGNYYRVESFSYGDAVDITAPGQNIYSTKLNNNYGYGNGTSFAAPFVVGTVALAKEKFPSYTNDDIYALLMLNTKKVEEHDNAWDEYVGYGFVQANFQKTLTKSEGTISLVEDKTGYEVPKNGAKSKIVPKGNYTFTSIYKDEETGITWYQIPFENERTKWIAVEMESLLNKETNRTVLLKNLPYYYSVSDLFDNNKKTYVGFNNGTEIIRRFETGVWAKGFEISFKDSVENADIDVTFYNYQREELCIFTVKNEGRYYIPNCIGGNQTHFVGIKKNGSGTVNVSELVVLGETLPFPKRTVDFHTTMTLSDNARTFFVDTPVSSGSIYIDNLKGKPLNIVKASDWSDYYNRFMKVQIDSEASGIDNLWMDVKYGDLPEIQEGDLLDEMYGQIIQDDGNYLASYMYDNNMQSRTMLYANKGQVYEFDNPVTITHMFAKNDPDYLDNQLELTFLDTEGNLFTEIIGDTQLFYRYFALQQTYENIKYIFIRNVGFNPITIPEIAFYGTKNNDIALPSVHVRHPITLSKSGFKLYDTPNALTYNESGTLESNQVVQSIQAWGLKENEDIYDWYQIEWNGELKWIQPKYQSVTVDEMHKHGIIDMVGVEILSSNKYKADNLIDNYPQYTANVSSNEMLEYRFKDTVSVKQFYISLNGYIANTPTNLRLELLDENKQLLHTLNIGHNEVYQRTIAFDETIENVRYFRITNLASTSKTIKDIDFK